MSLPVIWAGPALLDLYGVDHSTADRVFLSVLHFARTGDGDVRPVTFNEYQLEVEGWAVRFTADAVSLTVLRVQKLHGKRTT